MPLATRLAALRLHHDAAAKIRFHPCTANRLADDDHLLRGVDEGAWRGLKNSDGFLLIPDLACHRWRKTDNLPQSWGAVDGWSLAARRYDLLDLLNTKIRAVPGVISTETLVYLKLVKQQYNWGTR